MTPNLPTQPPPVPCQAATLITPPLPRPGQGRAVPPGAPSRAKSRLPLSTEPPKEGGQDMSEAGLVAQAAVQQVTLRWGRKLAGDAVAQPLGQRHLGPPAPPRAVVAGPGARVGRGRASEPTSCH